MQLTVEPSDNSAAVAAGGYDLVVFDRTAPSTETLTKIDTASLWVGPPVGGPFATAEGVTDPQVTRVRAGDAGHRRTQSPVTWGPLRRGR